MSRTHAEGETDWSEISTSLQDALSVSQETGIGFVGPWVLSSLALVTSQSDKKRKALERGEQLLAEGCVGHNYFAFYADAMEVAIQDNDWQALERYARALETYIEPEPLPLCQFHIERARALADHARDPSNASTQQRLRQLQSVAEKSKLGLAGRAIEAATAEA